ncbi:putative RNA-directed DNA polymerase [Helianthus annuus]|nr:putative RNA-directed DNA polymerase [Helianthus annuus]
MASSASPQEPSLNTILHMITIKLSSTNFLLWKAHMLPIFTLTKLMGHIDGTVTKPSPTVADGDKTKPNPDASRWDENEQTTIIILHSSLTEESAAEVLGITGAHQIWAALETAYSNSSIERIHSLRDTLRQLVKGSSSVTEFGRRFKTICDQLAAVGQPVADSDKVHWFLYGLGPSFETFSTAIRASKPAPNFRDLLSQAESHEIFLQSLHGTVSSPAAFHAQHSRSPSSNSRGKSSVYNGSRNGQHGGRSRHQSRRPPHCQLCRTSGHYASSCPRLYTFARQAPNPDEALAKAFHAQCHVTDNSPDWNADTGATDHMQPGFEGLDHAAPYQGKSHDRKTKRVLAKGVCENGLYVLKDSPQALVATTGVSTRASYELWHARLGHVSFDSISLLNKLGVLSVTSVLPKPNVCTPCQLSKSRRLSFEPNLKRASNPLDLIHCDLWGPAPVCSKDGYRYYVSFVDDYSRFTWLYPLKTKTGFYAVLPVFINLVQTQCSRKIKIFQSDGGTEFVNQTVRKIFEDNGTFHRLSCPHTPQQNGRSERKHRHIVETGLAMLFNAHIPASYWVDAFTSATFIINRLPTPLLENKSPFELIFSQQPQYANLRTYGCQVFPYLRDYSKHKLEPRSISCVFIGYSTQHKGYRCLDPTTSRIYITRHARFNETYFPFSGLNGSNDFTKLELTTFLDEPTNYQPTPQNPHYHPKTSANIYTTTVAHSTPTLPCSLCPNKAHNHPSTTPSTTSPTSQPNTQSLPNNLSTSSPNYNDPTTQPSPNPLTTNIQAINNQTTYDPSSPPTATSPNQPTSPIQPTSPTQPTVTTSQPSAPIQPENQTMSQTTSHPTTSSTHPMMTRAKSGIFKPKHQANLASLSSHPLHVALTASTEPRGYKSAAKNPKWIAAMHEEIDALKYNNTWTLVPRPSDTNVVGSKWVYRIKYHSDGSIERYKARLVAQGYTQIPGLDYSHTFSPVVKASTVRIVLSLAVLNDWKLHQLDVKNAFLNGNLTETVFMEQPPGFIHPQYPNHVCRLTKALYGLKQAPRAWFQRLSTFLTSYGFTCSRADTSLFVFSRESCIMYLLVYVDDLILTGNDETAIATFISCLNHEFAIKDLGDLNYFLGLEVAYSDNGLFLHQSKYATDILRRADLLDSKPVATPLAPHESFISQGDPYHDPTLYRSLVGALQYLTITRPDLSYAVNQVCQFLHAPTVDHFQSVKRILRYVKGTLSFGLTFSRHHKPSLVGFSDADWARCLETRRSTYGYSIFLGGNLVSWSAKKQPTVSRSSCESEYRAMANTAAEIVWITHLLEELRALPPNRPTLLCDNKSALFMTQNPVSHKRAKHIDLDYHFIRELVTSGKLYTKFVPTNLQVADIFTKSLPRAPFETFRAMLRLGPPPFRLKGGIRE